MSEFYQGKPMLSRKVLPNDKCPCKSGKKAKYCCGARTEYFRMEKPKLIPKEIEAFKPAVNKT